MNRDSVYGLKKIKLFHFLFCIEIVEKTQIIRRKYNDFKCKKNINKIVVFSLKKV